MTCWAAPTEIMAEINSLSKFAVEVANIHVPGNWDRPLGYDGTARFVAVYWDQATDDVFITDGIFGIAGGAWWLYTRLIYRDARSEIHAALMACGAHLENALGNSDHEAAYALILDRFEHGLWVGPIDPTISYLVKQYRTEGSSGASLDLALERQKKDLYHRGRVCTTIPCQCDRGWKLVGSNYVPCSDCDRRGRIVVIPQLVIQ